MIFQETTPSLQRSPFVVKVKDSSTSTVQPISKVKYNSPDSRRTPPVVKEKIGRMTAVVFGSITDAPANFSSVASPHTTKTEAPSLPFAGRLFVVRVRTLRTTAAQPTPKAGYDWRSNYRTLPVAKEQIGGMTAAAFGSITDAPENSWGAVSSGQ